MDSSAKMEARATTAGDRVGVVRQRPAPPSAKDPFRLGFRERRTTTPDGRQVLEQVPLTSEDLVYPQEGDHVSQGMPHFSFLHPQTDAMRRYLQKRPGIVVTSDVTIVLRHDGKNSGPDVAVIEGDFDPDLIEGAIKLRAVGGRLVFAFEAVSTSEKEIENKDLKNNKLRYAKEGVEEYFTVYPEPGRKVSNLVGRRLGAAKKYVEIAPDAQGRVYSKRLDVLFSIDAATQYLVAVNATSGERFRLSDEEEAGRVEAERCLAEETAARQKAEQRAEQEAAEKQKETAARQKAEAEKQKAEAEKQKAEAEKQKAEAALKQESQARLQALAEVERLKAQLRQIQEGGDG